MLNKNKEFWEKIIKELKKDFPDNDYEIIENYHGRFWENAEAALVTDVDPFEVKYMIKKILNENPEYENLSIDDFGKDGHIFY